MERLNDISITENLIAIDTNRFNSFIPNYLSKRLKPGSRVCSVGCGMAYDVEYLNKHGFDAWGFDPGNRTKVWANHRDPETLKKLRIAAAGDPELSGWSNSFDYAYALEVIEHVGTVDGNWRLKDNFFEERVKFIEGCFDLLKENGKLLLSTSNRLCPIDVGHGHHYNSFTDFVVRKTKIRLTNPWSAANFVCSLGDIREYARHGRYKDSFDIKALPTQMYLSNSRGNKSKFLIDVVNSYLKLASVSLWRTSFINPLLVVELTKKPQG